MDPLAPLIDTLTAEGRLRVWSLVITAFGDMIEPRGGVVPSARLGRLLGRIGVESGALRTALSRLAADGWITAKRQGRMSSYTLTPKGRQDFGPASKRIYAPPPVGPVPEWSFVTQPRTGALPFAGGWLLPGAVSGPGTVLTGRLSPGPEVWNGLDPDHRNAMERLMADLRALQAPLDTPLDAAAARLLLVHRWRRLILRWPLVPADLVPEGQPIRDMHSAVAAAYAALSPATAQWLTQADDALPPLPDPTPDEAMRFKSQQTS